jgi:hypothetical protein
LGIIHDRTLGKTKNHITFFGLLFRAISIVCICIVFEYTTQFYALLPDLCSPRSSVMNTINFVLMIIYTILIELYILFNIIYLLFYFFSKDKMQAIKYGEMKSFEEKFTGKITNKFCCFIFFILVVLLIIITFVILHFGYTMNKNINTLKIYESTCTARYHSLSSHNLCPMNTTNPY